jgi:putative flippase GtrA
VSLALGRCAAIGFNFATNSRFVFKRAADGFVFARYLLVVVAMTALAYVLMQGLQRQFGSAPITAKIIVESGLFMLSFALQRAFVFVSRKAEA